MAAPHLAEQVGRVLDGRYRVVSPIGTGASAAVYLADDTVLRRRVAIKVLHAGLASDKGFLRRFQAEAHTAAGLSHPNVMRVLDWGEGDDGPFLVLEYLGGGSLRSVLDHGTQLSPEQTVQLGIQAARALDYAHRRGLVHRDIKPANLLFDDEGRLAIADFGLARALAEAAWTEPGGAVLGTARYASPEQVRGQSLDGKADVYALALVLHEAVAQFVPFTADTTIATLMARLDRQLEAPSVLGRLGPVVEAAAHPDPEQRPSAAELVRLLEAAAAELPAPARITLPGAVPIDLTRVDDRDPTMLPNASTTVGPASVSVEARPLPPELRPKRRILRRNKGLADEVPAPIDSLADAQRDGAAAVKKRRRLRRPSLRRVLAVIAITILLAGAAGGAYALYYFTGSEIVVPQLEGLTPDAARIAAEQSDARLEFAAEEFSETVPAGQTFDQSPDVGASIYPRQAVTLRVSQGPAPREVPGVVGQGLDEVRNRFAELGFTIRSENRNDEQAPVGRILSQEPPGGLQPKDAEISFVVSSGPASRVVPDVRGQSREGATSRIAQERLRVNVREEFIGDVPAGQVAGTAPGAGASVARGSTVTILISKGPDLVAVPSVNGQNVTRATATLQAAGFTVNNVYGPAAGTVFDTEPAAATRIRRGANVALYTR